MKEKNIIFLGVLALIVYIAVPLLVVIFSSPKISPLDSSEDIRMAGFEQCVKANARFRPENLKYCNEFLKEKP